MVRSWPSAPLSSAPSLFPCSWRPRPLGAEIRISNLSVFFNDFEVTVQVVLLGAIPAPLHESLHSGVPTHVRFHVELWQYSRLWVERLIQRRTVERQLTYNVLTKEYRVMSLEGEQREPYLTKNLRDAQRVLSDLRVSRLAPSTALDTRELYYVRVRSDVSLNGENSWVARMAGDAAETPWVQSTLLTAEPDPVMPLASPQAEQGKRKRNLILISATLVVLIVGSIFEFALRAPQLPVASNLVVLALLNLNVIVFLLLLVLLFRNLVKLGFERRQKGIGSRFKAKLVLAFLSLALVPSILIFIIASNFITTSIEGWFKPQVERPLDQALEVAQTYYQTLETTALRHGRFMARVVEREGSHVRDPARAPRGLPRRAARPARALGGDALRPAAAARCCTSRIRPSARWAPRAIAQGKITQGLGGQEVTTVQELDNGDMVQAVVPVRDLDREVIGDPGGVHPRRRSGWRTAFAGSARPSRNTSSSSCSRTPSRASTSCSSS